MDQTSASSDDVVLFFSWIMKTAKRLFICFVKTVLVPLTASKISLLSSQMPWNERISMDVPYVIKEINYNLYDSQKCCSNMFSSLFISACRIFQPLFYALKRACNLEVFMALFDHFPGAVLEKDFCGDLPLYLLFHPSKDVRMLQYVLSQRPSLALFQENTFSGQPLVKNICAPWSTQTKLSRNDVESDEVLKNRWTKLVLTVRAAYAHAKGQKQNSNIPQLHVALEMACCSPVVLCQFIEMYPEQVSMPIGIDGIFPLHYFLATHNVTKGSDRVISRLIQTFPQACKECHRGRFPLQIALSSGYTWSSGIRDVAFADSSILEKADLESGLIPFLQAAMASGGDLNTSYCLLRENPSLVDTMF